MQAFDNWAAVEKYPHVIGDFVWTAWDYLGESGIGHTSYEGEAGGLKPFPWHVANCGDLDICGRKWPQSHYRENIKRFTKFMQGGYKPKKENHTAPRDLCAQF